VRASLAVALLLTVTPVLAQSVDETARPPAPTQEQEGSALPAIPSDIAVLDEVLVTGEQAGPGLWKVTKNGNTLWILGTYGPLPKKMTWRSREVESIIAESQRVVRWVNIDTDVDIGFFAGLVALPYVFSAGNNPDGVKLKDVVPADAYAQWLILKTKYVGRDNDIEDLRPSFAALELRSKASSERGLSSEPVIWPAVERLAKKHRVKIIEPEVKMVIKIDKPRATIKKFRKTQLADVECFTHSLARLEGDLDAMKARANAWSVGKLDVLRSIPPPDPSTDCGQMLQKLLLNGQLADDLGAREMFDRVRAESERVTKQSIEVWLRTIDDTMRQHSSTLATVPIGILFGAQNPLQALRERGYEVEEP